MNIDSRPTVAHSIVLRYPSAWSAPRNAHSASAARRVEALLRRTGVLRGAAGERLFQNLDVPGYAGWPFPEAGREELAALAAFLTLWIYYDDVVEEQGERDMGGLERALRGEGETMDHGDPCHRAFHAVGREFRDAMSPAWLERHTHETMEWLRSVSEENALARSLRETGRSPLARDFLPVRRRSVGARPVFCWIEYVTGAELPEAALGDERVRVIQRCGAEVIASVNELMGWHKDREARWPNLVDCVAEEEGLSTARAFARVVAKHNTLVEEMEDAMADLCADRRLGAVMRGWTRAMGHVTLGLARWHQGATRYRTRQIVAPGHEVALGIELTDEEPMFALAS